MNYKDVVNRIQTIVEDHKMLVDFGYGQVSDIKTRAQGTEGEADGADYPYLFLNPTQHVRTQQQITYNFNMIVMDMAREEEAHEYQNFLNIQSDSIQYIDDVVARLYYFYKDKPEVSMDLNYTPFYERFQDDLAGATATLSIVVPNSINECIAPFNPEPLPPQDCLRTLTVFSNSQNEFEYVKDPDDASRNWRWEDNTQENLLIGEFTDQYFENTATGDFEFYVTQNIRFIEPAAGEVLPQPPVLTNLQGDYGPITLTCDSGNWPTVWSPESITYIAKYNVNIPTQTSFGVVGFEDGAANESAMVQEVGGTLSIGFDGVIPPPPVASLVLDVDTSTDQIFRPDTAGSPLNMNGTVTLDTYNALRVGTPNYYNITQNGTWRFVVTGTAYRVTNNATPFTTGLNMAVRPNSGPELSYEANPQTWPLNPAVNVDFDFELEWDAFELNGANIQYVAFNTPNEPAVEDEFYIKAGAVVKAYFTPA